ncbi:MAG: hypothetical protein HYS09_04755 [Chloroflexi bacterium]|nr:hypothetical protein [Chloroflexota bacterium]
MGRIIGDLVTSLRALIRPVFGSLRANASLAVLSVVLAFVLWIFVSDTEGGTTLEVQVNALTSRGGVKVLDAAPSELDVTLVPLFSNSVPVLVEFRGSPPSGFKAGEPQAEPATATVSGTQELVSLVARAVAMVDLNGATEDIVGAFTLGAEDERGGLVKGVTLEPSAVEVSVPIEQEEFSRVFSVNPDVRGAPADGYNLNGVRVDPPTIIVVGPQDLLDVLFFVRTATVDITGATDDVLKTVSLDLPAGATVSGSGRVTVRVTIKSAGGLVTFGVTPAVVGLAPGLRVVGSLPLVEVTVSGPLPLLRTLTAASLSVEVDLSGLGEGRHTVDVEVEAPTDTKATADPEEVEVTLRPR